MATTLVEAPAQRGLVTKIAVEKLFGHYTYEMKPSDPAGADPRLLLLYGDNGSGKTTIAQLLFHLLSPGGRAGHRTFLAQTRFKRFCVVFDDRISISAERRGQALDGEYYLVAKDGGASTEVHARTSDDGAVRDDTIDDKKLQEFFAAFPTPLATYFISDARILQSDVFADEEEERDSTRRRKMTVSRGDSGERFVDNGPRREVIVVPSIARAETWMRRQALAASTAGEVSISNIYGDILERIAQPPTAEQTTESRDVVQLLGSLHLLSERAKEFAALGLASPVPIETLTKTLTSVDESRVSLIAGVLEPYVNSIGARLDALAHIQRRLSVFLWIINAFYKRKTVELTVENGIQVIDQAGERLSPSLLSSGEQQLMLLLCNILAATGQPSLFIIDEPELSLNVKWQRELVDSLLQLVEGSEVQFVMATHSIELLTRHNSSVLKLETIEGVTVHAPGSSDGA
ncbi:MAG: ATP-binding protein, partial [Candidatus Nealsonbacteria bacterium]|nr:ATP-binding protein [Candidatus Nealsonbacteria bacterium]